MWNRTVLNKRCSFFTPKMKFSSLKFLGHDQFYWEVARVSQNSAGPKETLWTWSHKIGTKAIRFRTKEAVETSSRSSSRKNSIIWKQPRFMTWMYLLIFRDVERIHRFLNNYCLFCGTLASVLKWQTKNCVPSSSPTRHSKKIECFEFKSNA